MDAATLQVFRTDDWQTRDSSSLTPESCHLMPSGNRMPLLGLGTWHLSHHTVDSLCSALELGYRMLDTSSDYHTQRGIGDALRACGHERDELYLVTKVDPDDDGYAATRRNLAQMKVNYADLVLIHRPPKDSLHAKAWDGLRRAKREGLVHDIGVSSYSIEQIEELVYRTGEMPAVNQIEWTPFGHSPSMLDFCRDNGILIQSWSPLTRAERLNDSRVGSMASRYGKTPAQLLLRWNLQQGVVPLPKANHVQHQRDNLSVFDFEITAGDMTKLNALNEHYSALGRLLYI